MVKALLLLDCIDNLCCEEIVWRQLEFAFFGARLRLRTFYFGGITMFCSKCGKEIDNEAVVCVHCGCPTQNYQNDKQTKDQPIIINNNNSASSSAAAAAAAGGRVRRKHSLLFDLFMICITGGLWIIWMILRPKYY